MLNLREPLKLMLIVMSWGLAEKRSLTSQFFCPSKTLLKLRTSCACQENMLVLPAICITQKIQDLPLAQYYCLKSVNTKTALLASKVLFKPWPNILIYKIVAYIPILYKNSNSILFFVLASKLKFKSEHSHSRKP